jgi:hypothetical protein
MADQGRRHFFSDVLREGAKVLAGFRQGLQEAEQEARTEAYFDSYQSSYALTLCEEELLLDSARQAGIETEDRDRNEVAKELFAKQEAAK